MTAEVFDLELSSLRLPQDRSELSRELVGKAEFHDDAFRSRYDTKTLFYDCFVDAEANEVLLIGPPLLNLRQYVEEATFFVDGRSVSIKEIRDISRCSVIALDAADGTNLTIQHALFGGQISIGRSYIDELSGLNGLYTISLNNRLEWIKDWLNYYVRLHGAETVVLSDNGSTDYSLAQLRKTISGVRGLQKAVILRAPYPFGPTAENKTAYSALFLQRSLAELCRLRFFARARAVLNVDIDELVHSKKGQSIFDAAAASTDGYVRADAEWVYTLEPSEKGFARHVDHAYVSTSGKPKANRKWCIVPNGPQKGRQWLTHFIGSRKDPVNSDFRLWHFRQVSTGWKFGRSNVETELTHNPELADTMNRAFVNYQGHAQTSDMSLRAKVDYDEVIVTNGIKVPFVSKIITPSIEKPMRNSRYLDGECKALRELLQPGDRVLECGAGVGLLSTIAAISDGVDSVTAVEANPKLIPVIEETHRLNGVQDVNLIYGVVSPQTTEPLDFYLRKDFRASSIEPDSHPYVSVVQVPSLGITDLIKDQDPTVIAIDIEGGELGLLDHADLSNVRLLIIEFHPKIYGDENVRAITDMLAKKGLKIGPVEEPTTVGRFFREITPLQPVSLQPAAQRFLISTCMKDEGPFILEWIAWHKSIGINDFVVFTNDCSDGTDLILDRLEELGQLRHLPNPAVATGSTYFQPIALSYAPYLSEWRKADFYISMDVDEFINIRVGSGHISDLIDATGGFDALSMSELNHGSNGQMNFKPGLVTEQFPRHQSEEPRRRDARRGVKTITRLSEKLDRVRNHRPDFMPGQDDVVWIDGSGRPLDTLQGDKTLNGIDVRGSYDLIVLDHFPLRSLESYLIKMFRGDVVISKNRVSQRYWRTRNRDESQTSNFDRQQKAFKKVFDEYLTDPELRSLYEKTCKIHVDRAAELLTKPEFIERKEWILANAWST